MIDNDKVYIGDSANGKGVFAARKLLKGERIMGFYSKRKVVTHKESPSPHLNDYYVQVDKDIYLGPSGEAGEFVNHSCDPNAGLIFNPEREITLAAIKDIEKGEEITWDYSTTMDEDCWEMDCNCGSEKCRKRIRDFKYLPQEIKERYAKLGIVPDYNLVYLADN